MSDETDPDGISYQEFLADLAAECRCCPDCTLVPCPGLCAGGFCDRLCVCDDEDERDDNFEDEDE